MNKSTAQVLDDSFEIESQRLQALYRYGVLDTSPEQRYDDLVEIASYICQTPIALITLVDSGRQWFKARVGLDASETSRAVAFCAHAIENPTEMFVVPDATQDAKFSDNPLVTGIPNIRFYAGMPLLTSDNQALGTMCVIDTKPRTLTPAQSRALKALTNQAAAQLELGRLNLELARSNSELENFAQVAAHDIQTPLRHMSAFSQLLMDDLGGNLSAQQREYLAYTCRSAKQLGDLVHGLLHSSQLGRLEETPQLIDMQALCEEVIDLLWPSIEALNASVDIDGALPEIQGSQPAIRGLVTNLVANALKFTRPGIPPVVTIGCESTGDAHHFCVTDNGLGIEAKNYERVFEPGWRLQEFRPADGTGLGLAYCRKVVEQHRGSIWIGPAAAAGAVLNFTIPI